MDADAMARQCLSKVRYKTYDKAERMKLRCEEIRPEQKLRIYPCTVCSYWHLAREKVAVIREAEE